MNKQLLDGFSAAVQELAAEPDVSVLPVTGDDQAFATPPTGRRPGDPQDVLSPRHGIEHGSPALASYGARGVTLG